MCFTQEQIDKLNKFRQQCEGDPDLPASVTDLFPDLGIDDDFQPETREDNISRKVVSRVAYLIGVPEDQFGKNYLASVYEELETKDQAKIIRSLCMIRNAILCNPGTIVDKLRNYGKNLDSIPEVIDPQLFTYLQENRIRIITGSTLKKLTEYVAIINGSISNQINNCKDLFPIWVKFDYIREMIVMPKGSKETVVQSNIDQMKDHRNLYPFACYVNWPMNKKECLVLDPENHEEVTSVNLIYHDAFFLTMLYRIHGDEFTDVHRFTEADQSTTGILTDFIENNQDIVILVDCENSDPYKLCGTLEYIRQLNAQSVTNNENEISHLRRISKIILFDDAHTVDTWDVLGKYVPVPIVHEETERVVGHKSLVDIALAVGACKEYYTNGTKAFMIASSDSDFWGLMRAMSDCNFLVLGERDKLSREAENFYAGHDITVCVMDSFANNMEKIREGAIRYSMANKINRMITVNFDEALDTLYGELRTDMSSREKESYREQLVKNLQITVNDAGELVVGFRE